MDRIDLPATRRTVVKAALGSTFAVALGADGAARAAASTSRAFPHGEYRIVQTNLRATDVAQDPVRIARDVRDFGATTLLSSVGGIVAFYPTKLPLQYRNPAMEGDFTGRMVDAAHKLGLGFIGRFDLSKALRPVFDVHPDWFMRNRDGSPREYAGTYQACPNGGWAQDYGLRILEEGLRRYPLDGVFFNMVGYTRTDYANVDHGICICQNCQAAFRQMYGLDLPKTDGPTDPNWQPYTQFQSRTLGDLAKRTIGLVRKARPDAALMDFFAGDVARGEVQRRVDSPAPEWPFAMGEQVRWATAAWPTRPFSATSAAQIDYPWREASESAARHMLRFAQALGTGGKLDLYLIGTLADQEDRSWLQPISELFRWHATNEAAYAGLRPSARVGLYSAAYAFTGGAIQLLDARRGAYHLLVDARRPFSNVDASQVMAKGISALDGFDVIIMADVQRLSDEEARALDAFVERGGLLIATGKTGAKDGKGKPRSLQALASSPVEAFLDDREGRGWSLDARDAPLKMEAGRIPVDGPYHATRVRPEARDLVPFAPDHPFGPPELAYPQPGTVPRKDPGVLAMTFGKGTVVHIPWQPDALYQRDGLDVHRLLFDALIERFAPPAPVRLTGTGAVEVTLQRQVETGATMIHVINYAGQHDSSYVTPPELHGLRLGIRAQSIGQAVALRSGQKLEPGPQKDGYVWFDLPPIGYFEAIRVTPSA